LFNVNSSQCQWSDLDCRDFKCRSILCHCDRICPCFIWVTYICDCQTIICRGGIWRMFRNCWYWQDIISDTACTRI